METSRPSRYLLGIFSVSSLVPSLFLFGKPGLDRYAMHAVPPIHIVVANGKVTLEGVVATEGDRNQAGIYANTVSGVFSVTNNLRMEGDQK
jgi:hyperosmotically inducible protein